MNLNNLFSFFFIFDSLSFFSQRKILWEEDIQFGVSVINIIEEANVLNK